METTRTEKTAIEHYFFPFFRSRANAIRPGYHGVQMGVKKSRDAIENSLSKARGFNFADMEEAIRYSNVLSMHTVHAVFLGVFCHPGCSAFAYTIPFRDP